ncbi:MAG: 3-oxoacyl-[acyl-carrier-protein] reductase [Terriglobales bacterium]
MSDYRGIRLDGRVALVTGGSQGIGRACAIALAEAGAVVALAARNEGKLAETAGLISGSGGRAETFKLDVASEEEIKAGIKAIVAKLGKLDILVNNAGITRDQLALRMKRGDWDDVMTTNLTGAYLCSQQALGPMLRQRWGRIINISSVFGQIGQAGQANYAASKAGLIGLTMALAREVASRNITVNAVAPGWVETAMTDGLAPDLKKSALQMIPLGRAGTAQEVAAAVRFLASEEARYITGHVLNVNGGMLMG